MSTEPRTTDQEGGDTTPPFTPEQLAWIDRLVAARQSALAPHSSGASPETIPPPTDPVPGGITGGTSGSGKFSWQTYRLEREESTGMLAAATAVLGYWPRADGHSRREHQAAHRSGQDTIT